MQRQGTGGVVVHTSQWGQALVTVAVATCVLGGCGGDREKTSDEPGAVQGAELFASDESLGKVAAVAQDLADVTHNYSDKCDTAPGELEGIGSPAELAELAGDIDDPELAELALEQQAALSSLLAACRGDAPISTEEAAAELAVTNEALTESLKEHR